MTATVIIELNSLYTCLLTQQPIDQSHGPNKQTGTKGRSGQSERGLQFLRLAGQCECRHRLLCRRTTYRFLAGGTLWQCAADKSLFDIGITIDDVSWSTSSHCWLTCLSFRCPSIICQGQVSPPLVSRPSPPPPPSEWRACVRVLREAQYAVCLNLPRKADWADQGTAALHSSKLPWHLSYLKWVSAPKPLGSGCVFSPYAGSCSSTFECLPHLHGWINCINCVVSRRCQLPPPTYGATAPQWARASSLSRLHDHTQTHTALGRTPLDEGSARRRDLYLTTHNTHKWETSMPPAGFEPTVLASKRSQTHTVDRAATGVGGQWKAYSDKYLSATPASVAEGRRLTDWAMTRWLRVLR
jgi:hypothetical protein